jgi:hypothetical protein
MGIFSKKKICPNCMQAVDDKDKFCSHCSYDLSTSLEAPLKSVPGHAGLYRWERQSDEIARRIDVSMLPSDRIGVRKGLLVRPDQRAILIQDGKQLAVLGPGNYALSENGLGTNLDTRLMNYLSGRFHCEIYLVVNGEFRVTIGPKEVEESTASADQVSLTEDDLALISHLVATYADVGAADRDTDPGLRPLRRALDNLRAKEKEPDFQATEEHRKQVGILETKIHDQMLERSRRERANAERPLWLPVRTMEGHEVGLLADLYLRIEGNEEFVVQTMRHRNRLTDYELIGEIQPALVNLLQFVIARVPIDDLHGNMGLNQRIRDAFVDQLTPALANWGLRICRAEGLEWDFGRYKNVHFREAEAAIDKKKRQLDWLDEEDRNELEHRQHDHQVARERREHERRIEQIGQEQKEAEQHNALEIAQSQGAQEIKSQENRADIARNEERRKSEIALERIEREAQLDTLERVTKVRQNELQAEQQRALERLRVMKELFSSTLPDQMLPILAAQYPHLVPALQAYWSNEATQRQLDLVRDFQTQVVQIYDGNQEKLAALMKQAQQVIGHVGAAGLIAASHDRVRLTADGLCCGGCGRLLPEPSTKLQVCPSCNARLLPPIAAADDPITDQAT